MKIRKTKGFSFWKFYAVYAAVLAVLVVAAVSYVNGKLQEYEEELPERRVEEALAQMKEAAAAGDFLTQYQMEEVTAGRFEEHLNVQETYLGLFVGEELTYSRKSGVQEEDMLCYVVENGELPLAEVQLQSVGEPESMLAVLTIRKWEVVSVQPLLEATDYELTVPDSFEVTVNGIRLAAKDGVSSGENEVTYSLEGLYLEPDVLITAPDGNAAKYAIKDHRILPEIYYYVLTLPDMLSVSLNGERCEGETVEEQLVRYDICELEKPEVVLRDLYGNEYRYEGGSQIPLTFMTVSADERYTLTIDGKEAAAEGITVKPNKEYEQLEAYVDGLPQTREYALAILKENAELTVLDENGHAIVLEKGLNHYDLTDVRREATVPESIAAKVDVLDVAQKWSLFMSKDYPIGQLVTYLLPDSYQYKMAVKYASSVDITFTSSHVLNNPAFTEMAVTNFKQITEDCFSVDISFVKHMILRNGLKVDDPMNDRFYFVNSPDGWKLAGMKEIVDHD